MPNYDVRFAVGSRVRISGRSALEEFRRTWKYHNKLQSVQIEYAGRVAKVVKTGIYHGGDILYVLENVSGVWHEQCLELEK